MSGIVLGTEEQDRVPVVKKKKKTPKIRVGETNL